MVPLVILTVCEKKGSKTVVGTSMGQFEKTRQELDWEKIVKTTHYSYACNTLTNFEYEGCVMTGNGNNVTWQKFACEYS